ncbi:MAG: TolC family protein [Opitutaceae bacterium]|nr:TolC family protein [Opitutaceae bacterium]
MIVHRFSSSVLAILGGFCLSLTLACRAENAPAAAAPAPTTASDAPAMPLKECIIRALKQNFDVQIQSYTLASAQDALEIAKSTFDPTISLSAERNFSQTTNTNNRLSGAVNPVSDSGSYRLSISQPVSSGGTVSLGSNLSRSSSNSTYYTFNPAYSGAVSLSVTQPLLKNFGRQIALANIETSEIGVARASLDFKAQVLNVVQSTETAYYNYLFAREQEHVMQQSLGLATQVYEENKTKRTVGTATDIDILTAEVGVANARRQLLLAQQQTRNSADSLLALIGQFELDQPIGATPFDDYIGPVPTIDAVYARAIANQPDYLSTKAAIDQTKISLRLAQDAKRPELDLTGSLSSNGIDSTAGNAYQDIPRGDSYSWAMGLTLSFPWGFHGDSARYRQALAALRQQELVLRQLEQNVLVQVRASVRAVETNLENVKIAALATRLSEKNYDLEKARFDAGLTTARLLQQARDDLDSARVNELQSRVNLRHAIISLNRLQGTSLDTYGIALP